MPLAAQAFLPFLARLGAAVIVRRRPRRASNGWISVAATGLAGIIAMVELLRLAPGEHVDVPYLTTFPYADLAIRLDGLSLAFASVTLLTAALLMLARLRLHGDRRDPWFSWLLTAAATCAVIFAHNLLLVYIALQLLTLAWTLALDETARRRRKLRLSVQVADIGLLLAAASAIQSVGTSGFSGVPSDTFALPAFVLVLLPVVARVAALAVTAGGPQATVAFEPAIVWVAPAGYLLMRMLALMGGRLPDRPTAVVLFAAATLVALSAIAALSRLKRPRSFQLDPPTVWAAGLLLIAAFPIVAMSRLVVPAAATVRLVPGGTVATSPFGIVAGGRFFPALVVSLLVGIALGVAWWLKAPTLSSPASWGGKSPAARWGGKIKVPTLPALPTVPPWGRFVLWG